MNKELNEKIAAVSAKYEKERQLLLGRRQSSAQHIDKIEANQRTLPAREHPRGSSAYQTDRAPEVLSYSANRQEDYSVNRQEDYSVNRTNTRDYLPRR